MTPHTARASSQPLAVAAFGLRQTVRVKDDYAPVLAEAPGAAQKDPDSSGLLPRRRRRRARLAARW
ncbi:MAG: hypothetical protein ACK4P2_05325 [Hyphomonas sp.]